MVKVFGVQKDSGDYCSAILHKLTLDYQASFAPLVPYHVWWSGAFMVTSCHLLFCAAFAQPLTEYRKHILPMYSILSLQ
jgi:hypothetical protein